MIAKPSLTLTVCLFDADIISRTRDIAEERVEAAPDTKTRDWWQQLVSVCDDMFAGERDESELASWVRLYQLEEALGIEPRRES